MPAAEPTASFAVQAVLDAFGLGSLQATPTYVARGAMGEVWRVETRDGRFALKALFSWADYPERPADIDVQLAAAAAGVPIPRPVLVGGGGGVGVVEVDGGRFRAYEWVDLGRPLAAPVPVATAAEAGDILGRIHALGLPLEATAAPGDHMVDEWYRTPPSKDRLVALARAGSGEGRSWAPIVIAMFGAIDELLAQVGGEVAEPIVCHRDFGLENVLPAADGSGLVVLDWENAGPLPPDQELAAALLEFSTGAGTVDREAVDAFLAGYARGGGTAVIHGPSSFAMAVYTALNYCRVLMEQSLDDDRHRDFAETTLLDVLGRYLPNLMAALSVLASR